MNYMGAFFDSLKNSAKVGTDEVKKSMRVGQLQSEISLLEKQQHDIYAKIGIIAVESDGLDKYGDLGTRLTEIQENLAGKSVELAELKPEEPKSAAAESSGDAGGFCKTCGTKYTAGTKFCSSCGAKLT